MPFSSRARAEFASQLSGQVQLTPKVKKAFEQIDRALFVPAGLSSYALDALPMGASQWISSPITVAKMTMALESETGDSVLEIGCGSGYQAAILGKLFRRVFTVERIERLLNEARGRFKKLGSINIHTKLGDGHEGWSEHAPFDRILLSCEIGEIPQTLFDQLEPNGILVAPVNGKITKYRKYNSGRVIKEELDSCTFVPMLKGVEKV